MTKSCAYRVLRSVINALRWLRSVGGELTLVGSSGATRPAVTPCRRIFSRTLVLLYLSGRDSRCSRAWFPVDLDQFEVSPRSHYVRTMAIAQGQVHHLERTGVFDNPLHFR